MTIHNIIPAILDLALDIGPCDPIFVALFTYKLNICLAQNPSNKLGNACVMHACNAIMMDNLP